MKKAIIRIVACALALMMLAGMMVGCAGGNKMTVTVTVQLGSDYIDFKYAEASSKGDKDFLIAQSDRKIMENKEISVIYGDDEQVSVLSALAEACANNDISLVRDSTETSVQSIMDYAGQSYNPTSGTPIEGYDKAVTFFWSYTVNGKEPEEGRAGTNYVKDGDVIVFTLTGATAAE